MGRNGERGDVGLCAGILVTFTQNINLFLQLRKINTERFYFILRVVLWNEHEKLNEMSEAFDTILCADW